jgi:hypothetical protein
MIPHVIVLEPGPEFERRQIAAVRKELDDEYEAAVGLNVQPSKGGAQAKISSTSQT